MTPTSTTPSPRTSHRGRAATSSRAAGAPVRPRRVSGPVRAPERTLPRPEPRPAPRLRPARRAAPAPGRPLARRALAFLALLPDHPLLDRVVRGRVWIPLLGVLLAGIVAMQVEVLKLGAGVGRSLAVSTELQSQNELLRVRVAGLADDQRIESMAAGMGMVMPAPAQVNFLGHPSAGYARRAASSVHTPDAAAFQPSVPVNGTTASSATGGSAGSTGG